MDKEMINITAHLVGDVTKSSFIGQEGLPVQVANFSLVKKYGAGKEYINCAVYGQKVDITETFEKGDMIHIYGYFKENIKGDKVYKNFIVKSLNKVDSESHQEES